MVEYVAGFMFKEDRVALIEKTKPTWQKGKLNGIGGKIEPGETIWQAMVREFEEETGYKTQESDWKHFVTLYGQDYTCYFFSGYGPIEKLVTTTEEKIVLFYVNNINTYNSIPNLTWLIPMSKSLEIAPGWSYKVTEERRDRT